MNETGSQFRTAALGGFNKQDVLDYISRVTKTYREQLAEAKNELEALRQERSELSARCAAAEAARREAVSQLQRDSELLAQRTAALEASEQALFSLQKEHGRANARLEEMEGKVGQVAEDAAAYAVLKQRIAAIELEAHRSAQETMDQAEAQAAAVREELDCWLRKLQDGYQLLRTDIFASVGHLSGELDRSRRSLDEARAAFARCDEILSALPSWRRGGTAEAEVPPAALPGEAVKDSILPPEAEAAGLPESEALAPGEPTGLEELQAFSTLEAAADMPESGKGEANAPKEADLGKKAEELHD